MGEVPISDLFYLLLSSNVNKGRVKESMKNWVEKNRLTQTLKIADIGDLRPWGVANPHKGWSGILKLDTEGIEIGQGTW